MLTRQQIKLISSLKYKKYRDRHQFFVAEGRKIIEDLCPAFQCRYLVGEEAEIKALGPGETDVVHVHILPGQGADHAGVPGPFRHHSGQHHIAQPRPQHAHDGKNHDLARERHHDVAEAHQQRLHRAPQQAGQHTQKRADGNGCEHGQQGKAQRAAHPEKQAGKDVPAQMVGAQPMCAAPGGKLVFDVHFQRIAGRDPGRQQPCRQHQHDKDETAQAQTVLLLLKS